MIKLLKSRVKENFTFVDIVLLKLFGAIPAFFIGAYFPTFFKNFGGPLVVLFILLLFRYVYILFVIDKFEIKPHITEIDTSLKY